MLEIRTEEHASLYVKCQLFLSDLIRHRSVWTHFCKAPKYQIS
jgi:hypothetical protein